MKIDKKHSLILPSITLKDSLKKLEENYYKCLIVVDKNNKLLGTITDGDIRRAILKGAKFNDKINKYYFRKANFIFGSENLRDIKNFKKNKLRPKLSIVDKYKFSKIFNKIKNKYLLSQNNLENISFVIKIANNYKIKSKVILETLNMFKGLPHRQEKIKLTKITFCKQQQQNEL